MLLGLETNIFILFKYIFFCLNNFSGCKYRETKIGSAFLLFYNVKTYDDELDVSFLFKFHINSVKVPKNGSKSF